MIRIKSPQPEGQMYETGQEALRANNPVVLGVCLGNSYFKRDKIAELIAFVKEQRFASVFIFIPPITDTYRGMGYNDSKAESNSRNEFKNIANHVRSAMDENSVNYKILQTDEIERENSFQAALAQIRQLYQSNGAFQAACNEITQEVLENRVQQQLERLKKQGKQVSDSSISYETIDLQKGVEYLFKLLAFRLSANQILDCKSYAFLYYEEFALLADLLAGKYGREYQKFADHLGQVVYTDPSNSAQRD